MKRPETKIQELKERLDMELVAPEQFIQFVHDVIQNMPEAWKDPMSRAYLEGKGQLFDENTGKPLTADSRYHIMTEHARRAFQTINELAKNSPATLEWLIRLYNHG